ncbi:MAG: choline kinase [Flavobacteriaceae bacterium]|nr:choline kinase [Flavobacteriaceae bacterium]|tara:strand:- start:139250 stop:140200 length:951 start_codon:yes stop_codon:yes gene_type:complete
MNTQLKSFILSTTGATDMQVVESIQTLWSGYGEMLRIELQNSTEKTVVVKHIQLDNQTSHPRGWNTDIGHQRKLKSYQVESYWYQNYSSTSKSRLPKCFGVEQSDKDIFIVLEDLDAAGYPLRKHQLNWHEFNACIEWLANFHASFLGAHPEGIWSIGTYWHLDTRPSELHALQDENLKKVAAAIDARLNNCRFKTLVHGDAKLANFCFSEDGRVAGVDFQYVGGGCGMKDLAYFVGSCLSESDCERLEDQILDSYFKYLQRALPEPNLELETEWRLLYRVAWADFHRFLKGWSPDHWKINSYSERITREVIERIK